MPTIHRIGVFAIRIYPNDHGPIHVHAVEHGFAARIFLDGSVEIITGRARKGLGSVVDWVLANEAIVIAAWERTRPR